MGFVNSTEPSTRTGAGRRLAGGALRHAVAAGTLTLGALTVTALVYVVLLLVALVTGQDAGGPLALPMMLLMALAGTLLASGLLFLPSSALTRVLCRALKWPWPAEMPVAAAILMLLCAGLGPLIGLGGDSASQDALLGLGAGLVLLVPLGVYWWMLQFTGWGLALVGWCWGRLWAGARWVGAAIHRRRATA